MFFEYRKDGFCEITREQFSPDVLTVGYVDYNELCEDYERFGFDKSTVDACNDANGYFRSNVEIYDSYTFTELRIIGRPDEAEDCVAVYFKKNCFIVVDVEDHDGSTRKKVLDALQRCRHENVTLERVVYIFLDSLVTEDIKTLESISTMLPEFEEDIFKDQVGKNFNLDLLTLKKRLMRFHNYYEQLLDITDVIEENENGIFNGASLMSISNISNKVSRLREDTDSLKNTVEHLQDAYSSWLDSKMNNTMKIFTVLTSIFFPLTIIVGWYGMNFQSMPEFTWKYGYVYVIALSVVIVLVTMLIAKKKKWF